MRYSLSQLLAPLALLAIPGCTASWNALVLYSDRPSPTGQGAELGVYAAVLAEYVDPRRRSVTLAPLDSVVGEVAGYVTGRPVRVPGYWADALRQAVEVALADLRSPESATPALVAIAAAQVGLHLTPNRDFQPPVSRADNGGLLAARLWLSRPGFNRDSTIAVVRSTYWCGMRCAHGITRVLARRPGYQWRVWMSWLHWVS